MSDTGRYSPPPEEGGGHDGAGMMRWLLTYADMITLLLAFFIVLYAASSINAKKLAEVASSIRGAFGIPAGESRINDRGLGGERLLPMPNVMDRVSEELSIALRADAEAGKVQILKTPRGIVLRFQDTAVFDLGRADLRPEAKVMFDKVAPIVKPLQNTIEAEGHTDDLPIRSREFPSNWELSAARAISVVRYFMETHGLHPERLTARGMGEWRPLYPNQPRQGEARNRRVEINLLR
jgi:chemotaxis protein MotB